MVFGSEGIEEPDAHPKRRAEAKGRMILECVMPLQMRRRLVCSSLTGVCLNGPLGIGERVAARVFHKRAREARDQQASRLVHLRKDRLTAAVGQPHFGHWEIRGADAPLPHAGVF